MRKISAIILILIIFSSGIYSSVDLWVRSQGPEATQAEDALYQVLKPIGARYNLASVKIHYIFDYNRETGELRSMRGLEEAKEDIRQMIIQKHFPEKFWCYLRSRNTHFDDSFWTKDARICGIEVQSVRNLMKKEGEKLAISEAELKDSLGINSSPTLFIDGRRIRNWNGAFPSLLMLIRNANNDTFAEGALPECIDDRDCIPKSSKHIAYCKKGKCRSEKAPKVNLKVVRPDTTLGNISKDMIKFFRSRVINLSVNYVKYDSQEGRRLVELCGLKSLPAYIFDSNIQKDRNFSALRDKLLTVRTTQKLLYLVKPQTVESSYYLNREEHEDEIGIFVMSECPFSTALEESLYARGQTENIELHYITRKDSATGKFESLHGRKEVYENRRQIVIQEYFKDKFWKYLSCANKSGFADTCLSHAGIKRDSLKRLMRLHGDSLLSEDAALCDSLNIKGSPTILWKNRRIIKGAKSVNEVLDISATKGKCQ